MRQTQRKRKEKKTTPVTWISGVIHVLVPNVDESFHEVRQEWLFLDLGRWEASVCKCIAVAAMRYRLR